MAQQHEYCESSLLEGAAPLPAAMVGAMLPSSPAHTSSLAAAGRQGRAVQAVNAVMTHSAQKRLVSQPSNLSREKQLVFQSLGFQMGQLVPLRRGSAKGVKACVVRIAAALDPFAPELKALAGAVSWEKPVNAGLLHVAIMTAVFHPWTIFPGLSLWLAVHTVGGCTSLIHSVFS